MKFGLPDLVDDVDSRSRQDMDKFPGDHEIRSDLHLEAPFGCKTSLKFSGR